METRFKTCHVGHFYHACFHFKWRDVSGASQSGRADNLTRSGDFSVEIYCYYLLLSLLFICAARLFAERRNIQNEHNKTTEDMKVLQHNTHTTQHTLPETVSRFYKQSMVEAAE